MVKAQSISVMAAVAITAGCGQGLRFADAAKGTPVQVASSGTPVAAQSTMNATPIANVDGLPAMDVRVTLRDANGTAASGYPVSLTAFNTQPTTFQQRGVTDANGQFDVQVVSQFSGPKMLDAHFSGQHMQSTVTFKTTGTACAAGPFFGQPPMITGLQVAADVASQDINEDSFLDTVWADSGSNSVVVALGDGRGRFTVLPGVPAGAGAGSVGVCFINSDGYADVVIGNNQGLVVFLGTASGAVTQSASFAAGTGVLVPVACVDLNNDFLDDAILFDANTSRVVAYISDGSGTNFTKKTSALSMAATDIALANLNSDGFVDVYAIDGSGHVAAAMGNGDGTFGASMTYTVPGQNTEAIAADVTGDGNLDITSASAQASNLSILVGDGAGHFTLSPNTVALAGAPSAVHDGDLNGDGDIDLVAASSTTGTLFAVINNGHGGFLAPVAYPLAYGAVAMDVEDYNHDGHQDTMTAVNSSGLAGGSLLLGRSDGTFADYATYPTDITPRFVGAADMDNDGDLDLVLSNANASDLQLYRNNGQGVFNGPFTFPVYAHPDTLAISDVNGDGWLDCVAGVDLAAGGILLLLNTGDGNLTAPILLPASGNTWGSVIIDLNGDGRADLLTANREGYTVAVLMQEENGGFSAPTFYPVGDESPSSGPAELLVGDVNGDGFIDVFAPSFNEDVPVGLLGNASGAFDQAFRGVLPASIPLQSGTGGIAFVDLNGDGLGDVCTSATGEGITVYMSSGSALTATTLMQSPGTWYELDAGDLNGDGKPDMIGAAYNQGVVAIYPGNGDGTFGAPWWYGTAMQSYGIATGDFDKDGRMDFAQINRGNQTLGVHLNTGCP